MVGTEGHSYENPDLQGIKAGLGLKKDYSFYFIRLHLLQAELQKKKANGEWNPKHLPEYLKKMMHGHAFVKMTPAERKTLNELERDVKKNFGK